MVVLSKDYFLHGNLFFRKCFSVTIITVKAMIKNPVTIFSNNLDSSFEIKVFVKLEWLLKYNCPDELGKQGHGMLIEPHKRRCSFC